MGSKSILNANTTRGGESDNYNILAKSYAMQCKFMVIDCKISCPLLAQAPYVFIQCRTKARGKT